MLALIDSKTLGSFRGYIWQKSIEGYNYEVEILHKQGFLVKTQEVLDNCETAQEVLQELLQIYDRQESENIFSEFG